MTPPVAQITICGVLDRAAITTLVEVAMAAGAALMLQPPPAAALPAGDVVVEAVRPRRRSVVRKQARRAVPVAPPAAVDVRVQRALRNGPLLVGDFLKATGLDKRGARKLVAGGAIVATGVTRGRRYSLPGPPGKEGP